MWPSGVSPSAAILVTLIVMAIGQMKIEKKDFQLYRLKDMDDLMPPINPLSPIENKIDCAMLCVDDVTCAAFSYSGFIKFCMIAPEQMRPSDVAISLNLPGFQHFNVFEDIRKSLLPPGYRTFSIWNLAIRFHYYWPKSWNDASAVCASEGGRLLTLDTEERRVLLQDLVLANKALNVSGLELYVGGSKNGTDFYWQTGSILTDSDPMWTSSAPTGSGNCTVLDRGEGFRLVDSNCTFERPYVCEHLYFESDNPTPIVGTFRLN